MLSLIFKSWSTRLLMNIKMRCIIKTSILIDMTLKVIY